MFIEYTQSDVRLTLSTEEINLLKSILSDETKSLCARSRALRHALEGVASEYKINRMCCDANIDITRSYKSNIDSAIKPQGFITTLEHKND